MGSGAVCILGEIEDQRYDDAKQYRQKSGTQPQAALAQQFFGQIQECQTGKAKQNRENSGDDLQPKDTGNGTNQIQHKTINIRFPSDVDPLLP